MSETQVAEKPARSPSGADEVAEDARDGIAARGMKLGSV